MNKTETKSLTIFIKCRQMRRRNFCRLITNHMMINMMWLNIKRCQRYRKIFIEGILMILAQLWHRCPPTAAEIAQKDTRCTAAWVSVFGDWDSFRSCKICFNPSSLGCQAISWEQTAPWVILQSVERSAINPTRCFSSPHSWEPSDDAGLSSNVNHLL